jgi:hypothetical protein
VDERTGSNAGAFQRAALIPRELREETSVEAGRATIAVV